MCDATQIVDKYFAALARRDLETVRGLIRDDLSFTGPLATLDNATDYLQGLAHITAGITGLDRRHVFQDGENVVQIYDVALAGPGQTVPVAEWMTVRDGKIATIEMIMDPRPLVAPQVA